VIEKFNASTGSSSPCLPPLQQVLSKALPAKFRRDERAQTQFLPQETEVLHEPRDGVWHYVQRDLKMPFRFYLSFQCSL